jgi:hypothetical protein
MVSSTRTLNPTESCADKSSVIRGALRPGSSCKASWSADGRTLWFSSGSRAALPGANVIAEAAAGGGWRERNAATSTCERHFVSIGFTVK